MLRKVLSIIMVAVLIICSVPFGTLTSFAKSSKSFEKSIYIADYLSNCYIGPTSLEGTQQSKLLDTYTNAGYQEKSASHILLESINNNKKLMNNVAAWKVATFKPSNITDSMLDEKGYYEAIIFSILDKNLKSQAFEDATNSTLDMLLRTLLSSALEITKDFAEIEYDNLIYLPIDEIDGDVLLEIQKELKIQIKAFDNEIKSYSFLSKLLNYSKTLDDYISQVSNFAMLSTCAEDIKNVLYFMYENCPEDEQIMKLALSECYVACSNAFGAFLTNVLNGEMEFANIAFNLLVDSFWKSTVDSLAGSLVCGVLIGQALGTAISNFLFSGESFIEQIFVMESMCNFIDLSVMAVNAFESNYITNQTQSNAKAYICAVDMLMSANELGCDYSKEMLDILYSEGLVNSIYNIFATNKDYEDKKRSINNIENDIIFNHSTMLDIYSYSYYLLEDYPDIYELYFSHLESNFTYTVSNYEATITGLVEGFTPEKLVIPSTIGGYPVRHIGAEAVPINDWLINVTIPEGVVTIETSAISWCDSLELVNIPSTVTKIGDFAFSSCEKLKYISIPPGVTNIGEGVFCGCDSIDIYVDTNNKYYSAENGVLYNKDKTKLLCYPNNGNDETFIIPNSVKEIADYAFYDSDFLTTITIPNHVKKIGVASFRYCTSLTSVVFSNNSISSISMGAFAHCYSLKYVILNKQITFIDSSSFLNCGNLENVYYCGSLSESSCMNIMNSYNESLEYANWHYNFSFGDANCDGRINSLDLTNVKTSLMADYDITCDVNADSFVNVLDLIKLKKYLAGENVVLGQ